MAGGFQRNLRRVLVDERALEFALVEVNRDDVHDDDFQGMQEHGYVGWPVHEVFSDGRLEGCPIEYVTFERQKC